MSLQRGCSHSGTLRVLEPVAAVLSRGKITPGRVRYYTETVAKGLEEYLSGHGEAPGRWQGQGAAVEGLAGQVTVEHMALLFGGDHARHPTTALPLGERYAVGRAADKVLGWDLTLSAPKSFSALWAVADPGLRPDLEGCHQAAVAAALTYVEEHGAFTRQGKAGVAQVDSAGLVVARFDHRTSRAGDPQRHSHLLVSGRVRRSLDGAWRALDSRALHPQLKPAGMLYQAALRAETQARLALEWGEISRDGQAEIVGVPAGLVAMWSKRRRQIDTVAAGRVAQAELALGRPLTASERRRTYQEATLASRTAKATDGATVEDLHHHWRQEAADAGFDPAGWLHSVTERPAAHRKQVDLDPEALIARVLDELEAERSTWARVDVVARVARALPPGAAGSAASTRQLIEDLADRALSEPRVIPLIRPAHICPETLPPERRRDGRSIYEHHGTRRHTTALTLERETVVLDFATTGRHAGVALADPADVEHAVAAADLDPEQAQAVRRLTLDGEALACLVGPAGSGKTRSLGAAARAWEAAGIEIRGLAVSAMAAEVLAQGSDIPTDTLAKFLYEHQRPGRTRPDWALPHGAAVVLDEASQASSADLAELVGIIDAAQAKLILAGDHRQLGAVEAGGLFRLLVHDTNPSALSGARRFTEAWERQASLRLRHADTTVLADYQRHGRISGGDDDHIVDQAVDRWQSARHARQSVIVMAADHGTVDIIAQRIRALRASRGEVELGGVPTADAIVGVGDEIVTLRNDRRLISTTGAWVRNGDRWIIQHRTRRDALDVASLEGRGRLRLPPGYVAEHVDLAYALTIHKAEGTTVDRGVLVADDATTDLGLYVGMTRGRHSNHVLVITDPDPQHHTPTRTKNDPVDILTAVLSRDTAERSAVETFRDIIGDPALLRIRDELDRALGHTSARLRSNTRWTADIARADVEADITDIDWPS